MSDAMRDWQDRPVEVPAGWTEQPPYGWLRTWLRQFGRLTVAATNNGSGEGFRARWPGDDSGVEVDDAGDPLLFPSLAAVEEEFRRLVAAWMA